MFAVLAGLVDRLLGLPPASTPGVEIRRDIRIPMPDGVSLLADHYRPTSTEPKPMPVVLIRTPYGHHGLPTRLLGWTLARRGLQVVVQSVRGTSGSDGEFRPFHREKADGLATAAWLRAQPWCDGRLATAGPSYLGYTQWALGPYLDPPLEAMCLSVATADFGSDFYPGGSVSLLNMLTWSALIGRPQDRPFDMLRALLHDRFRARSATSTLPLREADIAAIKRPVPYWREVIEHAEPGDDFWSAIDHRPGRAGMTTPTSMVSGWYDLFLPGQLADFRALAAAGHRTRITIGPWAHGDLGTARATLVDAVSWLSAHLRDDTSQPRQPPVRVYLQYAARWLEFAQWPPAEAVPTRIHLHQGGALRWTAPDSGTPDRIVFDPADPTPSVGGPLLSGKTRQRDNREVEARLDVLIYSSEALTHDLDLVGDLRATIHLRVEPGHADLFVRLCDVDPAGVSRNVCDGIVRLRPGAVAADAEGVLAVEVPMFPTGYRFRRGHRLRVQVTPGAFPRFARNHGTGDRVADAVATQRCHYQIWHDAAHPSHLVLPVLDAHK